MTNSNLHLTVMRRVRTINALQSAAGPVGASIVLLILSLYLIGREVWVARVLQNMPSFANVQAFVHFFTYAFIHTSVVVQALSLLTIFATLWLLREVTRIFVIGSPKFA